MTDFFQRRILGHRVTRIAIWLLGLYVLIGLALVLGENRLAFPGWTFKKPWLGVPTGAAVEDLSIPTSDGNTIQAWWVARPGWTPSKGAVLYLHGNGENLSTGGRAMVKWRDELQTGVLAFDYPGFGHSTGTPNEQTCNAAALASYDWLVREKKVAGRDIVIVGQSMGSAVATALAFRQPCRMLVTSGAFTSFPDIAQHRFFWLPVRHLARLQFDNLGKISRVEAPVFITHGTADRVIPFSHGERLYAAAKEPKRFYLIPGHGHSQPKTEEFYSAVRQFLTETRPGPSPVMFGQ